MALKCGDCRYFVKAAFFGSYCDLLKRTTYKNELVSANGLACSKFESAEFCCRDCAGFNGYNDYCDRKSFYVEKLKPACVNFTRKGDNGPDKTTDCFLTSACVRYLGKSDDCEELTELRSFRDNYMKNAEGGVQLIEEYYKIAPAIVEKIEKSDCAVSYYDYIYKVIKKCVDMLSENKCEEILEEYKKMVINLKKQLL